MIVAMWSRVHAVMVVMTSRVVKEQDPDPVAQLQDLQQEEAGDQFVPYKLTGPGDVLHYHQCNILSQCTHY